MNRKWLSHQVIPFIVRKYRGLPMINLFSSGKHARPLEQCYWPICRATHGINCCFRYRMLVALTPAARYALFSDRGTLFHVVNVSFALSCTFIVYTQIFKHFIHNCAPKLAYPWIPDFDSFLISLAHNFDYIAIIQFLYVILILINIF